VVAAAVRRVVAFGPEFALPAFTAAGSLPAFTAAGSFPALPSAGALFLLLGEGIAGQSHESRQRYGRNAEVPSIHLRSSFRSWPRRADTGNKKREKPYEGPIPLIELPIE